MDPRIDTAQLLSQVTSQTPKTGKAARGRDPEKVKEQAQEFEAIFIQQVYKEMRKTIPNDGLIERGNADDMYIQLQDLEAARVTAKQGGIGLADMMMKQLLSE